MTNNLTASDPVGISFWLISMALVAATAFFFIERDRVAGKWKTSLTVSGLVTLIAAVHYFYMRDVWVSTGTSPTVFRYIDWLLTVPLLMIEFYLILSAVTKVPAGVFWRLLIGSIAMLGFGYAGEAGWMDAKMAFIPSMAAWFYIIWEIFKGEASQINAGLANANVQKAYKTMTLLVTVGWSIYPLGYFFGYFMGSQDPVMLNVIYNVADFWNKIAFGVVIWAAAVADSE
ncbi:bacteriorhodopsin-like [Porticoccaceae bacterium]|jgi:bacteriorhodopsin|uniref:Bacteriorhodopsin-like n=2 Tax=Gammaproteobacteria TaxID=1236 RepID=A0ABY5TNV6_9GAMM|nr:bacteriorhodopsin-like [Porticoccaceae bacterium]MDB4581195.1 bacteriorhodopsin-like [Porticoccaceae bacterium]UVW35528.1 bacteriorhodopsin-like [SAR92 clade bacterium H455]|tara:strand:- start:178 stop:867 length:690 start_codon:yes stop_codon:yes gene_type:complete